MKFEKVIRNQIRKKAFPGISVLVAEGESIRFRDQYGYRTLLPEKQLLQADTLYDVASLTKPLITSFLTAALIEQNQISLNTRARTIFPELPFDFTILHLLTHTSGLPAWYPFYLYGLDYRKEFKSLKLESGPGEKVNYSCVGYILLYLIIQHICECSFSRLAKEIIFDRLNLTSTFLRVPDREKARAAPTEMGNRYERAMAESGHRAAAERFHWRSALIQGETHDANSYYSGGTAGNSGLFSTVSDIFKMTREFFPETATLLKPESIRLFWKNFTPGQKSHRSLGFKLNTSIISSGGRALSPSAIGHSGFTGTSVWLEPSPGNQFILLSNRIHPDVKKMNFNHIRRRIHKLLKRDLNLTGIR